MAKNYFNGFYVREVLTEEEQKTEVERIAKSNNLDEAETLRLARLIRKEEWEWSIIRKQLLSSEESF